MGGNKSVFCSWCKFEEVQNQAKVSLGKDDEEGKQVWDVIEMFIETKSAWHKTCLEEK